MERFDDGLKKWREGIERWMRERCECPPDGGFDKPTLTIVSRAHLTISGHLRPMWSDQSYFIVPVTQEFLDEVMSKQPEKSHHGNQIEYYVSDMGRVIGMSPSGGGNFEPRRDVTVVVQATHCIGKYLAGLRSGNEVITMCPGKSRRKGGP